MFLLSYSLFVYLTISLEVTNQIADGTVQKPPEGSEMSKTTKPRLPNVEDVWEIVYSRFFEVINTNLFRKEISIKCKIYMFYKVLDDTQDFLVTLLKLTQGLEQKDQLILKIRIGGSFLLHMEKLNLFFAKNKLDYEYEADKNSLGFLYLHTFSSARQNAIFYETLNDACEYLKAGLESITIDAALWLEQEEDKLEKIYGKSAVFCQEALPFE